MKDKLQTLFGGFGFVLYFIAIWLLSFYPLLFCEFPWWGDVLYIAVICFFSESLITSILSTVIYIIAFVNALHSPVDFWTIIFLCFKK